MIDRLLEFSVRQRGLVVLGALLVAAAGLWSASRLPIDAVPDITNIQVQINTEVPALAPEEIEKLVTVPLETELSGVPGMTELRSLSKFGLSQLTLIFSDGTDLYRARQLVSERLPSARGSLPPGLQPELAPISTGLGEIFYYAVDYAPGAAPKPATRREQLMELKLIHDFTVKPLLRTVPGLAEINASGGYDRQLVVLPDPAKLRAANLTFADLAAILGENVENAGGGVVNQGTQQLIIRAVGRVQTAADIADLPVKFAAGVAPLRVRDLAEVAIGARVRTGAATENGREAVIGTAMMLAGENSRLVAKRAAARLAEIQPKLPPGVTLRPLYDRSDLVDRTIATVRKNLFEGAVLVVVVLLLLLGNGRAALIVAAAIPLSFLIAMTGMVQGNISGNLMSLGAIDFGLIIDGAVVIVENIVRRLAERQHQLGRRLNHGERTHTVLAASREVASPMFFGVLIITLVYVPILALTGVEGKMFRPMALTVMLCLGGALVLTLTLMPALCSFVLRGDLREGDNRIVRRCKKIYGAALDWSLRRRWIVTGGALALLGLALLGFRRLGGEFVPQLDEGSITAMVSRENTLNLDASLAQQEKIEQALLARVPELTRTFSRLGTSEVATDPMPVGAADLYLFYRPRGEWRRHNGKPITKAALAEIIRDEITATVPGQSVLVSQPIEMRFNELMEGTRADLAVKVFGEDYAVLEKLAAEIKGVLEQIPGAGEVEFEAAGRVPMLEVRVDRAALTRYNVHAAEVNRAITTALGGETVGSVIERGRRFDLAVRLPENLREDLTALRALPVRVGEAGLLPLAALATFERVESIDPIRRDSGQRRAAILVNLAGRDVESFVREARAAVSAKVNLPAGYVLEFGGAFKNLEEARSRLALLVPATLALIFVLVFMAFGSVRQTLVIYTGVPLAATGGVFALWVCGLPFSISAGVGFIALSGVAVLNGLVLLSTFNRRREEGHSVREAVREGSLERLRPILITALVASLGFLPMALATGSGAEVQRPLAVVVIGGILTASFLTLVLLPVLYCWVERDRPTGRATPRGESVSAARHSDQSIV
jgi:cobalt-zinc-cadmium resistance protein CzcA